MVSVDEINEAEKVLIKSIQSNTFEKEITYLVSSEANRTKLKIPLYVNQFNLYLDDNKILRCRSRIGKCSVPYCSKTPILLPAKHPYSGLIINDCHDKVFHSGIRDTLHQMRQRYCSGGGNR